MNLVEPLRVALRSLGANKLRSALTALGVIIGVGAVVALVSVGMGATHAITSSLEAMGPHLIIVMPVRALGGELYLDDIPELLETVPGLEAVAPSVSLSSTLRYGTETHDTSVEGATEATQHVRGVSPAFGRFITDPEVELRSQIAVVGQTVVKELFNGQNPIGETMYVRGQPFLVVGVLEAKGATMGQDQDDIVYIPVTAAQRMAGIIRVNAVYASATDADAARLATTYISSHFASRFGRSDAVRVTSQDQLLATIEETAGTLTLLLGALAGISLLVGGIGIMNIMLVSVSERRREIGIRRALGAKKRDILGQFLIESTVLCMAGAGLGVLLGLAGSRVVSILGGWDAVVSPGAILVAFGLALGVGLFFGVYPAQRAAGLDPIEALRNE